MLITPHGTYGTLSDLAPELKLATGTLRVYRHRSGDDFPNPAGTIGGDPVYLLADIATWLTNRTAPGTD